MHHYVYLISNIVEHKAYFGVRSCNCTPEEDTSYMSSSKLIKKLYKEKPQEFKKKILKTFDTRKEAMEWEIYLHNTYDVGRNPSFYNKAKQTSIGFDTSGGTTSKRIIYSEGQLIGEYGISFIKEVPSNPIKGRRAIFKCHCGKEFESLIQGIKTSHYKSCGCYRDWKSKQNVHTYQMGAILGDSGITYLRDLPKEGVRRKATFMCHCGNEFDAQISNVKNNHTTSCGCAIGKRKN